MASLVQQQAPCVACSSHLDVEEDDPNLGAEFSIEKLRQSQEGLHDIPSTVHGAPVSAAVRSKRHCLLHLICSQSQANFVAIAAAGGKRDIGTAQEDGRL